MIEKDHPILNAETRQIVGKWKRVTSERQAELVFSTQETFVYHPDGKFEAIALFEANAEGEQLVSKAEVLVSGDYSHSNSILSLTTLVPPKCDIEIDELNMFDTETQEGLISRVIQSLQRQDRTTHIDGKEWWLQDISEGHEVVLVRECNE